MSAIKSSYLCTARSILGCMKQSYRCNACHYDKAWKVYHPLALRGISEAGDFITRVKSTLKHSTST